MPSPDAPDPAAERGAIRRQNLRRLLPGCLAAAGALLLSGGGVLILALAGASGSQSVAAAMVVVAAGLAVAAGILIAPLLGERAGEPLIRLLYPAREFDRPQPKYSVAEALEKKGQPEAALAAFAKIAADYPGERRPHVETLRILLLTLRDARRAADAYHRAVAALPDPADREAVRRMYDAYRSAVAPKPDWQRTHVLEAPPRRLTRERRPPPPDERGAPPSA